MLGLTLGIHEMKKGGTFMFIKLPGGTVSEKKNQFHFLNVDTLYTNHTLCNGCIIT